MFPGSCSFGDPFPLTVQAPVLAGDFNLDGTVDSADYTVWRDGVGTTYTQADYNDWKINFGRTSLGNAATPSAVPEPASLLLVVLASVGAAGCARRRRARDTRRGGCSP